jgi:beta-glucosidase
LKSGESKKVNVKLYTEQLGYYTNSGERQWVIQPGTYQIKIGASSQDIRLQQSVILKGQPLKKPIREFYFSEISQL